MFYNKFFFIVSCSVIEVIIEEPSCTGSSESIQVFKHFNWWSSQSSLYKTVEIKVLDSPVVTVVSDFRNHLSCSSLYFLYLFYFINISPYMRGPELHACSRCGRTRDLCNWRISSLFLYLKLRAMNPSTLLSVSQLFSVCFGHLRSLVMMIPRSSYWSVVGNCWLNSL